MLNNSDNMARTGLLVVTSLSKIAISLTAARNHVLKTLYIQLYSPFNHTRPTPTFSKAISTIYTTSLRWCNDIDVRIIIGNLKANTPKKFTKSIDVLLFDNCFPVSETSRVSASFGNANIINLDDNGSAAGKASTETPTKIIKFDFDETGTPDECTVYDNVVLGGTFDRLHIGHKILLTEAALRAKKRLVVGVTDVNMVKSKILYELILPVQQRINDVIDFLTTIDNTLQYEVVSIQDPFGPTKSDPNLDMIIVSTETLRGGEKVNEVRAQNGLSELKIHCIDLIELEPDTNIKELKISSSNQRMDLLGTQLKKPIIDEKLTQLPRPYVIGLIGGIASGKSAMAKRLETFGAKIIDCDKLAHQLYEPNEPCYQRLVSEFGTEILLPDGQVNRKRLGEIVFNDCNKLEQLNGIIWPALLQLTRTIIKQIHDEGTCKVVILEAAVLLKAGWQTECHEIWSLIIPQKEAVKRLMERNQLTEEEALKRVAAQVDNETVVQHSNVVFCTMWSHEFSQKQADRAWTGLMKHLENLEKIAKLNQT